MEELKKQLKDEQWYVTELKKELEKYQEGTDGAIPFTKKVNVIALFVTEQCSLLSIFLSILCMGTWVVYVVLHVCFLLCMCLCWLHQISLV